MLFLCYWFRGRHASKLTEEEEDEEYLKEEEDGLSNTRLVTQPSCKCSLSLSLALTHTLFLHVLACTYACEIVLAFMFLILLNEINFMRS